MANHGSIGDSWPIAFSGCPRGHKVSRETQWPNGITDTRPRTRASAEIGHHRQGTQDGGTLTGAQAACGFKYSASKRTPFFQTSKVIAAILRASVRRAID